MARITVRLTPRAGRDAVDGWATPSADQALLRVRVAAAPVDGAANEALIRLLAKSLRVPPSAIHIAAGAAARTKIMDIDGLSDQEVHAAIG